MLTKEAVKKLRQCAVDQSLVRPWIEVCDDWLAMDTILGEEVATSGFVSQGNDSTCVATAIVNAGIHLNIQTPPHDELVRRLLCHDGDAIGADKVIEDVFGGRLKVASFDQFLGTGGILTILHPIFNFHSCLCYPDGEGYTLVNSWLGPNVCKNIGKREIEKMLPPHRHQRRFWAIGKA